MLLVKAQKQDRLDQFIQMKNQFYNVESQWVKKGNWINDLALECKGQSLIAADLEACEKYGFSY